ncbi:tyrosine-type recombinase/integrase [Massilia phyllosphaerae]|uniref:tyrosine-type recombinase/integrase n=1 Tax=Massilia phyllosphaerae TaxID=3106034 RepID=UPI002B1CD865|nr:integrase arm-type DNA-binding domain-containing protein [Massilia sp. SGZ-792]
MTRQLHTLTDLQLRRWIKEAEPVAKSDGNGLTFTLSKAGTASWTLRYYVGTKRRELTLGNYPDISLSDARKLAAQHRADVDQGKDPAKEKAVRKKEAATPKWTVAMLAEDYRAKRLVPEAFAPVTLYARNLDLKNVIIRRLGRHLVGEVTGKDIVQMLRDAGETWTMSKRVLTTASNMFKHGIGLHIIDINPCAGVDLVSLFGPRPSIKKRVMLSADDLRTLFKEIGTLGELNSLALRIQLATCVRTNELTQARWKDVDLTAGTWFVHDEQTKTRAGFHVPLAAAVIEWFKELKTLAGDSEYILPARIANKKSRPTIDPRTLWAALDRAYETKRLTVTKFTPHDTRSTAKGHMLNLGIAEHVTELALNHAQRGLSGIYDVRKEIPEKRDALNRWANFLVSLMPESTT